MIDLRSLRMASGRYRIYGAEVEEDLTLSQLLQFGSSVARGKPELPGLARQLGILALEFRSTFAVPTLGAGKPGQLNLQLFYLVVGFGQSVCSLIKLTLVALPVRKGGQ
jgi:hypothetical protein